MELLKELAQPDEIHAIPIFEALDKSVRELQLQKNGKTINVKGAKDFFKANKKLTTNAVVLALDSYGKYAMNKKGTLRLHAKSPYEKRMMTSVVKALTDKQYKVRRIKFEGGGKTWILQNK